MAKKQRKRRKVEWMVNDAPTFATVTHSWSLHWTKDGECIERVNNGPEARRPDMDFGTPNGDLLFPPWMQDIVTDSER